MARNEVCVELAYLLDCKGGGVPFFVGPVTLSCVHFYCPTVVVIVIAVIVIVVVVVVTMFVNVVTVVVLGSGRRPHGPLPPCHPPNGENTKAWV